VTYLVFNSGHIFFYSVDGNELLSSRKLPVKGPSERRKNNTVAQTIVNPPSTMKRSLQGAIAALDNGAK
jgi:hypothetical protein